MTGEERRKKIIEILADSVKPLSGTALAKEFSISRQVIVQDIALLRAENKNIISTNKGYMLYKTTQTNHTVREIVKVSHNTHQVLEEFYSIVDAGGTILNVFVEHELYGQIEADLYISNRTDAEEFYHKLSQCHNKPLKFLTDEIHYHTIEAKNRDTMEKILDNLTKKGILLF